MDIFKKITGEDHVPKDLLLLLLIGGFYYLSIALSNTFVNVYIWKQSQSFLDIGLYNLMIVIFQPLTFILAGRWAKRIDRVIVMRLGVISLAVFFITVLLLGSHASQFLLLLGALIGIGFGFYWLAFNVLTFEITEPETRDFFNGFLGLLSSFAGMIGPLTAGWIISSMEKFTGYKVIFAVSLFLFTLAVITSFYLRRRPADGHFVIKRIISERGNNPQWKRVLNAHFFQGLREGTFVFVIGIWVFITTKSEMALGTFGFVESAVLFISYFFVSRLIKPSGRKKAILIGGILLYASVYLIAFKLTYTTLIFYAVTAAIAYPVLLVPYVSMTYDVIGKGWQAAEMRIEYIVVKEMFYNSGRIVSIILFLATVLIFNKEGIRYLLLFIGLGHFFIYFCIRHVRLKTQHNRKINANSPEQFPDGESGSPI
ncbi:YQGE family putative transporter [Scopulibacillus darangshiensis]|uniref:YQGE family putative transporter n=1 Tax=Scopulibacillus darangshiensis TaxID=442528 RepID=A0A4R2P894_9BACL|nr:MFS transporter [Scopulibacillus darangshiensis]TCP31132.1 YQGE family putative transporter [Scopulibacillus darangshiensis]